MDIPEGLLGRVVDKAASMGAGYCDARFESIEGSELTLKDGEIKEAVPVLEQGLGVRVLLDGAWGFASTNRIVEEGVMATAEEAIILARFAASRIREKATLADVRAETATVGNSVRKDPRDMSFEEKASLLRELDRAARSVKGVHTMSASFMDGTMAWAFRSTEGASITYVGTMTTLQMSVVAREGSNITGFRTRIGGTRGLEILDEDPPVQKVEDAARRAVAMLSGIRSPSGRMPVIADGELTGVFVHEAVGHACEGDLVMAGESLLEGRIGETIGAPTVTIVDDPTIEGGFGSFPFDDEGVRAERKVLLEDGVLSDLINSRATAAKLGMTPNGGCRAQDYSSRPIVRMSNTLMMPGDMTMDELLEGIDRGVYFKGSRGGQVDTAQGSFQFNAQEAYLIEKGEVGPILKDASISGSTLRTLKDIDGLDKEMSPISVGFCGKGQWVPVGDAGPHVRIRDALVGGG